MILTSYLYVSVVILMHFLVFCKDIYQNVQPPRWNNNIFYIGAEFFLARQNAQLNEGDGRIVVGDNTGIETIILRPIRFQCVRVCSATGLHHTHTTVEHSYA
jgi:hypothetical protein